MYNDFLDNCAKILCTTLKYWFPEKGTKRGKTMNVDGKVYFEYSRSMSIYGMDEPEALHFHITPPRPAHITVTVDPDMGSVNAMPGSFGPCSWQPLTFHLHFNNKLTSHTYYNLKATKECVLALPGRDLVRETWIVNLPTPRGINELEVADLTPIPSRYVKPPGIKECPVNLECVVEMTYEVYMTGLAVVRVVGGSVDEELTRMSSKDRISVMRRYPLYGVDTAPGDFIETGFPERFGLMGEIINCPTFPLGIGYGPGGSTGFVQWMSALEDRKYITKDELSKIVRLFRKWEHHPERIAFTAENAKKQKIRKDLTTILNLICREDWEELRKYLSSMTE